MLAKELRSLWRSEMADTVQPYLWSDAEFFTYLTDAERMFCRLTDGIADGTTPEITDVNMAAGDTWADIDPRILKIRGITRVSDGRPVDLLNFEDLEPRGLRFDGSTGTISSVIVGMEENKLRALRVVSAADTLSMLVFRLPLDAITKGDQSPEISEQHHEALLMWVKHRAYGKQDSQTLDKNKAADFEMQFRAYCRSARAEQQAKRHKPRTVRYGGI